MRVSQKKRFYWRIFSASQETGSLSRVAFPVPSKFLFLTKCHFWKWADGGAAHVVSSTTNLVAPKPEQMHLHAQRAAKKQNAFWRYVERQSWQSIYIYYIRYYSPATWCTAVALSSVIYCVKYAKKNCIHISVDTLTRAKPHCLEDVCYVHALTRLFFHASQCADFLHLKTVDLVETSL